MPKNRLLIIAGWLSIAAALLHVACIFGGPDWYRFFGAGEQMAQMAAAGDSFPTIATLIIAGILTSWGLYAFSAGGVFPKLPLLKTALVLVTAIYLARGILGFIAPFITDSQQIHHNSMTFWMVSSAICTIFGCFYLIGLKQFWRDSKLLSAQ